ncbi:hypothetical protein Egran_01922 [Elaphomyces granulatus]|uniref:ATP-dependent DNA helicase n=1 Tax=Elaphomyces granulatus TaxID=519963 RepID=A0A232M2K5_9EURO|nr:hypothetical protein Egran_01922 [Elaphomyces granulatus]
MRRKASAAARFYVSKASGLKDLNREELAEALLTDDALRQIEQEQPLAIPSPLPLARHVASIFVTFSADMQWHDLHRHFPGAGDMITADDHARRRWIWDSVQNNPHIIAHYLIRLTAFIKPVHEHRIYWIPDPPDEVQRDLITIDSEEITAQRSVTDLRIPMRLSSACHSLIPSGTGIGKISRVDFFGSLEMDRGHNWSVYVGRCGIVSEAWDQMKAETPTTQTVTMDSSPLPLNPEQRKLYDTAVDQYSRELASDIPPPLLLNVDDVAGSGKIFRLKTCARLQELAEQVGRQSPVFRAAPTGEEVGPVVLLCGDFFQLPPVGGQPLYSLRHSHVEAIKGHQLYRAFDKTIRLTRVMRQHRLSPEEVASFDSELRLYFTTAEVREANAERLVATNQPVKKISAHHRSPMLPEPLRKRPTTGDPCVYWSQGYAHHQPLDRDGAHQWLDGFRS